MYGYFPQRFNLKMWLETLSEHRNEFHKLKSLSFSVVHYTSPPASYVEHLSYKVWGGKRLAV